MKNLLSIIFCLFILSVATSWSQYSSPLEFSASVGADVTQPNPQYRSPAIPAQLWFNGYNGANVYLTAEAIASVTFYRSLAVGGHVSASVNAGYYQRSGAPACSDLDLNLSRSSSGSATLPGSRKNVWAAFMETASVTAYISGRTEGSAYAQLKLTW